MTEVTESKVQFIVEVSWQWSAIGTEDTVKPGDYIVWIFWKSEVKSKGKGANPKWKW